MKIITVNLSHKMYSIHIGSDILNKVGKELIALGYRGKAVVVTNTKVGPIYGTALIESLKSEGFKPVLMEIPDGEEYKNLDTRRILSLSLIHI